MILDSRGHSGFRFGAALSEASALTGGGFSYKPQRQSAGGVISASLVSRSSSVDLSLQVLEGVLCLADG